MRFISWNTQGKKPAIIMTAQNQKETPSVNSLFATGFGADFICFQESGQGEWGNTANSVTGLAWVPQSASNSNNSIIKITNYHLNSTDNYHGYEIPWQVSEKEEITKQENPRCSLLLLWKTTLGDHNAFQVNGWYDKKDKHRPVFWVTTATGMRIGCIHAPCGGDLNYIQAAITEISKGANEWILIGDFNIHPDLLTNTVLQGAKVVKSGEKTQLSSGELDFAIYSGPKTGKCETGDSFVFSDHSQVRVQLS